MSEIKVSSCVSCPARGTAERSVGTRVGVCCADPEKRAVPGAPWNKIRPEPPSWCPAREGLVIRFEKSSSLQKIAKAQPTKPPRVREASDADYGDFDLDWFPCWVPDGSDF